MTNLITEARELCEKATPGPWTWRGVTDDSKYFLSAKDLVSEDSLIISAEDIYPGYPECGQDLVLNLSTDDAAFISRSRTLIPELCDALEKGEAELMHYHHLQKVTEGQMKQNQRLRRRLEKAEEKNKQLLHEVRKLARESVEREKVLAKLEAEVVAWAKAEQEGRCVMLPCKVGDTVRATVNRPYNGHDLTIHGEVVEMAAVIRVRYDSCRHVDFLANDFGKTVFLTREEAEAALVKEEEAP